MTGAVVDLGSNTFHLLIVSIPATDSKPMKVVHRSVYFTKLAGGGGKTIPEKIFNEALKALKTIAHKLIKYSPGFVRIVGTSVLRTADNSASFIKEAEKILGYPVEILDGASEAGYIADGSLLHRELRSGNNLIMDIGGGSTEFILLENGKIRWKHSTPLGVGVLKHSFFQNEIFTENDVEKAKSYVTSHLPFSKKDFQKLKCDRIGGASGTFEALEYLIFNTSGYTENLRYFEGERCRQLFQVISGMNLEERLQFPHMPEKRADLIPVGLWLVNLVMEITQCQSLFVSRYAIKEGVIHSSLSGLK